MNFGCKLHNLLDAFKLQSQPYLNELRKNWAISSCHLESHIKLFFHTTNHIWFIICCIRLLRFKCIQRNLYKRRNSIQSFRQKKRQKKDKKLRSGRRQLDNSYIDTIYYSLLYRYIEIVIVWKFVYNSVVGFTGYWSIKFSTSNFVVIY